MDRPVYASDRPTRAGRKHMDIRPAERANPDLPDYLSFMQSSYDAVKNDLISRLYKAHRALAYWTLADEPFVGSDKDIATLAATYNTLLDAIDAQKLRQGGPLQPFSDAQIVIDAAHYPVAFANLHAEANVAPGGTQGRTPLVFSIAPSEPAFDNQFGTLVSQVVIKLPDSC